MLQFTVPQFIDVEDKIFGPITIRQFLILLAGGLIIFLLYRLLYFIQFAIAGMIVLVATVVIAFIKVNGRPFHFFMMNFIQTMTRSRLRVWNNSQLNINIVEDLDVNVQVMTTKRVDTRNVSRSRLSELSLIVDTHGAYHDEGREVTRSPDLLRKIS